MLRSDGSKDLGDGQWRKFGSVMMVLFFLLAFLITADLGSKAEAAEKRPIRIGYIAPTTGTFAQFGKDMYDGFKMYLDEIHYTAAGRKIKVYFEDEVNPATAVTKARKLINSDKIDLLAGVFATPSAYAVAPVMQEAGIPFVVTSSGGDDLTQRKRSSTLIRLTYTGCNLGDPLADYAYHKLGWRTVVTAGWDYAFAYEVVGSFQKVFEDLGGKVIQKVWAPLSTMDYSPYVESLNPNADGLLDAIFSSASVRFLRSLKVSGKYTKKNQIVAGGSAVDGWLLPALGDLGVGIYSSYNWSAALQTPKNIEFVKKVQRRLHREATVGMSSNYTGAKWIVKAIEAVNGDVEDRGRFMHALRSIVMDFQGASLRGPLKIDKYGHNIQNIYIRRVEKKADVIPALRVPGNYEKTQNSVVFTYPAVSQFWTYNPEAYMAKPVFSRDYPPCKYCK